MKRAITAGLLLLAASCGRKKDWDEEIIVQVFKPRGVEVGTVTVSASQGAKTDTATVDGFGDCDANRVRVIPRQGASDVLTITATASQGGLAPASQQVTPPGSTTVKLVLGTSQELEPAGACTPTVKPPDPDGGPPKKATGAACTADGECQGGKCLTQLYNTGTLITFTGGYCSQDCETTGCDADGECVESTDGNGQLLGKYCLLKCAPGDGKCTRAGYTCNAAGGTCVPGSP